MEKVTLDTLLEKCAEQDKEIIENINIDTGRAFMRLKGVEPLSAYSAVLIVALASTLNALPKEDKEALLGVFDRVVHCKRTKPF